MGEMLRFESFWGAVAAFFLIQCFGFIVYNSFMFFIGISTSMPPLCIWGMMWLLAFVVFQGSVLRKITEYAGMHGPAEAFCSLKQLDDFAKLGIAVFFAGVFLAFVAGHYPFPRAEGDWPQIGLFYCFCWAASWMVSRPGRAPGFWRDNEGKKAGWKDLTIIAFFGLVFVAAGLAASLVEPFLFYTAGMIGFGIFTMAVAQLLVEDRIK